MGGFFGITVTPGNIVTTMIYIKPSTHFEN